MVSDFRERQNVYIGIVGCWKIENVRQYIILVYIHTHWDRYSIMMLHAAI